MLIVCSTLIIIMIRRRALPPTCRVRRPFAVRRNSGFPTPRPIAASCCWTPPAWRAQLTKIPVPSRPCAPVAGPRLSRLRELNRRLAPAGPDGGWTADNRYRRRRAAPARWIVDCRGRAKNDDVVESLSGGVIISYRCARAPPIDTRKPVINAIMT